jgi:AraC-like DNA-binding protein
MLSALFAIISQLSILHKSICITILLLLQPFRFLIVGPMGTGAVRYSAVRSENEVMAGPSEPPVSEHVSYVPAAPLRPYIDLCTGYRDAGTEPGRHRGLPSPYLTVIFTLNEPLVIAAHPDPAQRPGSFGTLVGGLHTAPALITHDGSQSGIQLRLSPLGARALLNMPAGELASIDVPGSAVLGSLAGQVHDRLRGMRSWPERFELLDRALLDRLRQADGAPGVSSEVRYAWRQLLRTGGTTPVAELAAETGWSDRHLRDRFRTETGLGPKEAARVIRFDRVRRRLQQRLAAGQSLALAELAAAAGYFDQAHLDREFRRLAGCPPTTWVAEEFRNVQAGPGGPLAE